MGCDIHFFVEKKVEGVWTLVWTKKLIVEEEFDDYSPNLRALLNEYPGQKIRSTDFSRLWKEKTKHPFYQERNYFLFALLADVRNYYENITPFSKPKGYPEDASEGYAWHYKFDLDDLHSASYFSLSELLAFDWDMPIRESGWLSAYNYYLCKVKKEVPLYWSSSCNTTELTKEEMETFIAKVRKEAAPRRSKDHILKTILKYDFKGEVRTEWTYTPRSLKLRFLEKTLPALQELASDTSTDDVRICFYFDN